MVVRIRDNNIVEVNGRPVVAPGPPGRPDAEVKNGMIYINGFAFNPKMGIFTKDTFLNWIFGR